MIQPNISEVICHALMLYAVANIKLMGSLYDLNKRTFYLISVDTNNLNDSAMSQPLPDDEYELLSNDDCREAFAALQEKSFRNF